MIGFEVTERRLLSSAWNNSIMYEKNSAKELLYSDLFNYFMLVMNLLIGKPPPPHSLTAAAHALIDVATALAPSTVEPTLSHR